MSVTVLDDWRLELTAAGRAPGTIALRISHARRLIEAAGVDPSEITRDHVVAWLAAGEWGPSGRASARASARTFCAWLYHTGRSEHDAAAYIPPVGIPRAVPRPAADSDIRDALARADEATRLAIEIMALCGLRRGEVARIRASDIEPVPGARWSLRVKGKGGHVRLVPCPSHLARRIRAAGGYVFPGADHGHISPGWLGKKIGRALPPGVTPHQLRHRYATATYRAAHDLRAVQALLGHARIDTTQVYVAVDTDSTAHAAAAAWNLAG